MCRYACRSSWLLGRFDQTDLVSSWVEERGEDQDVFRTEVRTNRSGHHGLTACLDNSLQRLIDVVNLDEEPR
jgi:hypothetical protein